MKCTEMLFGHQTHRRFFFFSAVSQCSRETDYFLLIENHIEPNEVARVEWMHPRAGAKFKDLFKLYSSS